MLIIRRKGFGLSLKERFNTVAYNTKAFRKMNIEHVPVLPWGLVLETESGLVINNRKAVALLSNKPKFRKLLSTSDVRVPLTFYTSEDASIYLMQEKHLPLIGRPRNHFAARNFIVCNTPADAYNSYFEGSVYWQELLPKEREFRIFVAFGRVWCFMEKVIEDKSQPAWNHSKGARFVIVPRSEWLSKACWYALEAERLSGIDIAAFDVILSDGKLYMLEGNTAPAITGDYKQAMFGAILEWASETWLKTGKLPEHYPVPDINAKGWRNYIFEGIL
jgi:glutathione synthase/RimK-type ligase-like ATP-grasp enzyme